MSDLKLFTPERNSGRSSSECGEMVSPDDATEDDDLYVRYADYLVLVKGQDALQANAARYSWLRSHHVFDTVRFRLQWQLPRWFSGGKSLDERLDAAIDDEIKREKSKK
jgi:hypothetical protein